MHPTSLPTRQPLPAALAAGLLAPIVAAFLAEHVALRPLEPGTAALIAGAAFAGTLVAGWIARRVRGSTDLYWLTLQTTGLVALGGVVLAGA